MPKIINGQFRNSEEDMIIPALRIIEKHKICSMSVIKDEMKNYIQLYAGDLEQSNSRNECKYKQIIGNMVSHSNSDFSKATNVIKEKENLYSLNDLGKELLLRDSNSLIMSTLFDYEDDFNVQQSSAYEDNVDLSEFNNRKPIKLDGSKSNRYKTNPRLSKTILKRSNYICNYAKIAGLDHTTFISNSNNENYLEAHHLIPMKAQKDFGDFNLDREENIVGLCPNCHMQVHHGTKEEKIKILEPLYKERIKLLQKCKGFKNITFDELLNKYYL